MLNAVALRLARRAYANEDFIDELFRHAMSTASSLEALRRLSQTDFLSQH
jgi:hypothetical protein